jgi:plasmid stabilization system protein ParE
VSYIIEISPDAKRDLFEISLYIKKNDSLEQARKIVSRLEDRIATLETMPSRGKRPPEMERFGPHSFRELHEPPFRIFYRVKGNIVQVLSFLDARRNVRDILADRIMKRSS